MRTYGEAIEVRTADPAASAATGSTVATSADPVHVVAPVQFLWRGRLYLVREVLAHWVELGTWWTARSPRTSVAAPAPAPAATAAASGFPVAWLVDAGGAEQPVPARSVAADVGAVEREVWRVEAASGRTARVGVYDLVRDVPAAPPEPSGGAPYPGPPRARWRLARALD